MTRSRTAVTSEDVLAANLQLSRQMAASYNESEPHFRPENVARVTAKLERVIAATAGERLLDLGCGTGFIVDIAKDLVPYIHAVDASQEMIDEIDLSGTATITTEVAETGTLDVQPQSFDVVTGYSFLHHLFEVGPTLRTAARALRPGGRLYVDLEPNKDFWKVIEGLDRCGSYDPIISREIEAISDHTGVALQTGVEPEIFDLAEWRKSTGGGFTETELRQELRRAGFTRCEFFFEWFVGQGQLINDPDLTREEAAAKAETIHELLTRALPLSRPLFKYLGFVAVLENEA
jgi:ubiquinone/menaquinone biosynthesis C-methylase UbiE